MDNRDGMPPVPRAGLQVATLTSVTAWAAPAMASGGGNGGGSAAIGDVVTGILIVASAYVMANVVVDRLQLQRRLLVMTGFEYVLLGLLLGPALAVGAFRDLTGLLPVIALAAGWFGLLRGMELDFRNLAQAPDGVSRVFFLQHVLPGLLTAFAAYYVFTHGLLGAFDPDGAKIAAGVLGCCAAADSSRPVDLLSRRYTVEGKLVPLLRRSARLGDLLVISVLGVLFCWFHVDDPNAKLTLDGASWTWIAIGLGSALGVLFHFFLAGDESEHSRFLALVGIITFASGAAYFLSLPALFVNLVLGVWLANIAKDGSEIRATLERTEGPMILVLLVLAGALVRVPPLLPTVVVTLGFIGLRVGGKLLGSVIASIGSPLRSDLFRGFLGHGEVTVAMAISYRLVYDGPIVDAAYAAILISVIVGDLVAPRVLRALLVDAGSIRREALKEVR